MGMLCRLYVQCPPPPAGGQGGCCWLDHASPTPPPPGFGLAWFTGAGVLSVLFFTAALALKQCLTRWLLSECLLTEQVSRTAQQSFLAAGFPRAP